MKQIKNLPVIVGILVTLGSAIMTIVTYFQIKAMTFGASLEVNNPRNRIILWIVGILGGLSLIYKEMKEERNKKLFEKYTKDTNEKKDAK
jgi:hypothetical protein